MIKMGRVVFLKYKKTLLTIVLALVLFTFFISNAVGSQMSIISQSDTKEIAQLASKETPQPGSKEDPLVTKTYADKYINDRIKVLENAVINLTNQVAHLQARVEKIISNFRPPIILKLGSQTAYLGNEAKTLDVAPFTDNGRTMVPFRFIGEALGAEVSWDASSKTVSYILGERTIKMPIGSNTIQLNGKAQSIDVPAKLVNGRTFVPVRMVSEMLGAKVDWNPQSREVTIIP
jgi:hypothetical protein